MHTPGKLILSDGTIYSGTGFGYLKPVAGEAVFNTGMVGYPETMTDPSYKGQILIMTYPLIGNYGIPDEERENGLLKNFESEEIHISGLIVTENVTEYSHWSAVESLEEWMYRKKIPGLFGVDTRMITRKLRGDGTIPGVLTFEGMDQPDLHDPNKDDLAGMVSVKEPVLYEKGPGKVVLVDCGVKNNIIQAFLRRNISVLRVPYDYDFLSVEADGIIISNGPGDPKVCSVTIENVKKAMSVNRPLLGICLGCQIIGLASGADTYKLKYGHRSHNQPVNESGTKRCYITSQNHGYAINSATLSQDWREWFVNDNDGTNEGIIHISKPFFGAQFHPEASPGPDDTEFIFDMFIRALR